MNKITKELIEFIDASPSCYHAISNVEKELDGYNRLYEDKEWDIKPDGKYYVIRKDSSLIAFRTPKGCPKSVKITASHSDSPSFKLKANSVIECEKHYTKLNTEKYGGMIMSTWFDRPLSLAGRIIIKENDEFVTRLVNIDKDLFIIPSVAIHMNRDTNEGVKYDAQVDTLPLMGDETAKDKFDEMLAKEAGVDTGDIMGMDLFLYNRTKGTVWGANDEYISSRGLDDLQCVYSTMKGFLANKSNNTENLDMLCIFDNEEVGSLTGQGADSTFLADVITRIGECLQLTQSQMLQAIANGYMISADNAHAVHPNHPELADPTNRPFMNCGVVIKFNANQKYTTDALSEAMFRDVCKRADVPVQTFTNKSNMAGGSTLGNIANRHISIKTVDIGLPQLAMHSAYETAGVKDTEYLIKVITEFYK